MINKKIQYLINTYETNCPFKLAKYLGIFVSHEDLGDTLGYYSKHFRMKFIHINQNANEKEQIYICSHELGHAIFHPNDNTSFLKKNTFFSANKKRD
ncbi:ImmA/IrrE family metallo-endopeptidase [Cytobacillus citreus]|uniref:ImmA/IrrE family metallo-endopeptidase n=1 Tax=Cytobacillus citreus TaxID=2833586 RepID=UPI00201759FF|nr:ImmA/IrrE family metallo-endopeptidase [Cytobacillus citreus]